MEQKLPSHDLIAEVVPFRLFFAILPNDAKMSKKAFYYSIDQHQNFQYRPFAQDFGPLSLVQVHRFLCLTRRHLLNQSIPIIFYTTNHPNYITNAMMLICTYVMIDKGKSADEAFEQFKLFQSFLRPYRDASTMYSLYDLPMISCLRGFEKAMKLGWYNPTTFNQEFWEHYEMIENGDMNWVIPDKLMAFATPYPTKDSVSGFTVCTPEDFVRMFKRIGINRVVRLSKKIYEEGVFINNGINFDDLFFEDGSVPPISIIENFLNIMNGTDRVALHCKAGLGRTYVLFF